MIPSRRPRCFSALQRAEIAEIEEERPELNGAYVVSVLFNEPKLLKLLRKHREYDIKEVSVLFNEPKLLKWSSDPQKEPAKPRFQCSSTSRNC